MLTLEEVKKDAVLTGIEPGQTLRYVLADDPGAGKTIMAGLFIRELLMRADARHVLIVAPGSLVEQWQDEMFEKFGISFTLFSREQVEQSRSGKPFDEIDLLVARPDQLGRPRVTFIIDHSVREGRDPVQVVSRRMQFIAIDPQGNASNAGWAPHLDLEPIAPADPRLMDDVLQAPWITISAIGPL